MGRMIATFALILHSCVGMAAEVIRSESGEFDLTEGRIASIAIPTSVAERYWLAELSIPSEVMARVSLKQQGQTTLLSPYVTGNTKLRFVTSSGDSVLIIESIQKHGNTPKIGQWSFTPIDQLPFPTVKEIGLDRIVSPMLKRIILERGSVKKSPFVERLPSLPESERLLTFIYQGAEHNVRLLGGPTNDIVELERIENSKIWAKSFVVPADTLLSYRLAPDVPTLEADKRENRVAILSKAQVDPLNPYIWPSEDHSLQYSVIDLENQVTKPANKYDPKRLSKHWFRSQTFSNTRSVSLYEPKDKQVSVSPSLLIMLDGQDYEKRVSVPARIDRLYDEGEIGPTFVIMINNPDAQARSSELPANPKFADFIADEVIPWVQATTGHAFKPNDVIIAGSSYGGLAALSVSLERPDKVGHVLSMSGSFWWRDSKGNMRQRLDSASQLPLSVYLSVGRFETGRGDSLGIFETNFSISEALQEKGVPNKLSIFSAGHDYFLWAHALEEGLRYLSKTIDKQK